MKYTLEELKADLALKKKLSVKAPTRFGKISALNRIEGLETRIRNKERRMKIVPRK